MRTLSLLVPTDFSDASLVAIEMALDLGAAMRVPPRLTLVHVWSGQEAVLPEMTLRTDAQGFSARLLEEAHFDTAASLDEAAEKAVAAAQAGRARVGGAQA